MLVVGIPHWRVDEGKKELLTKCVDSLDGYDRLLILNGRERTLPTAWNKLLKAGFDMGADHVIISNDDLTLEEGSLKDLCSDEVESPLVNGSIYKIFHGHMFCIPKKVWEEVGDFDEIFTNYWADTDYALRLVKHSVPVSINESVKVNHPEPGRTLKYTRTEAEDRNMFELKWGRTYFDPVNEYNN